MSRLHRTRPRPANRRKSTRRTGVESNGQSLRELWAWFLPNPGIFAQIRFHGNTKWNPVPLVFLALCFTWADARCLKDAFTHAAENCQSFFGAPPLGTYQGLMKALVRWTPSLLPRLIARLHERMRQIGGDHWRIGGWLPLAVDGSRATAPRTRSNEAAFCAADYGKGKTARYRRKKTKGMRRRQNERAPAAPQEPQVWITLLWHLGLRLPWCWRLGPSNSSEREHAAAMIERESFPEKTLFCGDAGFVGSAFWKRIVDQGHDFLVRVGANVHLVVELAEGQVLRQGHSQVVWCWPKDAIREGQPPLQLRLIHTRIGKAQVWLLTSVLDRRKLTLKQAVRFYQLRWGIELEFRGLKQTLDRSKLRCRQSDRLQVELDWSILGLAMAELFAWKEQVARQAADPAKRSVSEAVRALRWCLRNLEKRSELGESLSDRLAKAVTDESKRTSSKQARYRPKNPDKKKLGDPKIRVLTPVEREKLRKIGEASTA